MPERCFRGSTWWKAKLLNFVLLRGPLWPVHLSMCSSVIFLGIRGPNPPVLCFLQSPGEGCEQHWGRWVLSSNEISVLFRGQGFIEYINCYISCKDLHRNFYLSPSKHVWNSLFWKQLGESSSVQRGWSWQTFVQVIIGELWIKNLG